MPKTIYAKIKIVITDGANGLDVVQEMDYSLVHDDVIEHEIVDVEIPDDVD